MLKKIKSPQDIKKLSNKELIKLCKEIRKEIIDIVSKNGGHLASNLGVVELTVALHLVFNSPLDKIIFDVGHQCYCHKILTGRYEKFKNIRKTSEISCFLNPKESEHDAFLTGHGSNSISAALGINEANYINKKNNYTVAVIGDGALTGGLALESLNNAGTLKRNFIVVLNDNNMSICKNVGAMSKSLSGLKNFLKNLGFLYIGFINGHTITKLTKIFEDSKKISSPILIHVKTIKGKGYSFAEKDPEKFHSISGFNIKTGKTKKSSDSFSKIFGNSLCNFAKYDKKICAITAAMKSGTGLSEFFENFPNRSFDVGMAEGHAVTFSSGLASGKMLPVFAVYSSFLQRSYDQILHDVAIAETKLVLAIDRAGIVGEDGKTHQGLFDVSFLSAIPNVTIFAPTFFNELENMLKKALYKTPFISCIRYPKGLELYKPLDFISSFGVKSYDIYGEKKSKIVVITYGRLFSNVCLAFEKLKEKNIKICIVKLNVINPIPDPVFSFIKNFDNIFFLEEGMLKGGIGEHFLKKNIEKKINKNFYIKAIDNKFIEQNTVEKSFKELGFDSNGICKYIEEVLPF